VSSRVCARDDAQDLPQSGAVLKSAPRKFSMTQDIVLSTSSNSAYVCDSLHLAEQLGTDHKNLLQSIRRAQDVSATEGSRLHVQPRTYVDKRGKEQPILDLTLENLIEVSMYIEKLKPKFREYIKAVREVEAKQVAQLKAENKKLLNSPERVETERGVKYVKNIPPHQKMIVWYDEDSRETHRVLADSLEYEEIVPCLVSTMQAKANGMMRAAESLKRWNAAVNQAVRTGKPIPSAKQFGAATSYEPNILAAVRRHKRKR